VSLFLDTKKENWKKRKTLHFQENTHHSTYINKNVYHYCSDNDDDECGYHILSNHRTTKKKSVFPDRSRGTGETEIEESGEFCFFRGGIFGGKLL
jgi:hypothetical protein